MLRDRRGPAWWRRSPVRALATLAVIVTVLVMEGGRTMRAQDADPPPAISATELLTAAVAHGPNHKVEEQVRTVGFFHVFTITSRFGTFEAIGRSELMVRLQEIEALVALEDVSRTDVFLAAAGGSIVKIGQGAASVVTDPVNTAKGFGAGVKRMGVNLGRRTQRAVADAGNDSSASADSGAGDAAAAILGVNAAVRRWARKVGVDPYTTNAVLRQALADIAKVDVAGSIATKVVVPVPAPIGTLASVGDVVWGKDPEEVRKLNEQGLRTLKVAEADAGRFLGNRWWTLTWQTRFIAALTAVQPRGAADYVSTAALAANAREALFFVESVEMVQRWHQQDPIVALLPDSRALVTASKGGRVSVALPIDWLPWTADTHRSVTELTARARHEFKASHREVVIGGRASARSGRGLEALGWTVTSAPGAAGKGHPG